jgi:pyruvate-formate lyase
MEATHRTHFPNPQVVLRLYSGMNPALFEKALDVLGQGFPLPLLMNDDVNVPAMQAAYSCSREEAEQYIISNFKK